MLNIFKKKVNRELTIFAPVSGKVIPLSQVKDEVFNSGMMGKGVAIIPEKNKIVAPFDGTVEVIPSTNHAIVLKSDEGIELIIHIGMDTVNLEGKGFQRIVKEKDKVNKGDTLLLLDIEFLNEQNCDITTPVVVINANQYIIHNEQINCAIEGNSIIMKLERI